jgi:hypothetical protein
MLTGEILVLSKNLSSVEKCAAAHASGSFTFSLAFCNCANVEPDLEEQIGLCISQA